MKKKLPTLAALATYVGTIIGVGIFGLPYVALKSGFWTVLAFFAIIAPIIILGNIFYGEVSLHVPGNHRLPGYAKHFWGNKMKHFAFLINGAAAIGILLSYLIVGGQFLLNVFGPVFGGSQMIWVLVFFVIGSLLIHRGVVSIAESETVMLVMLLGLVAVYAVFGLKMVDVKNFSLGFDLKDIFLPWGVIVFSLWGMHALPLIREILGNRHRAFKRIIISSILISAVVYIVFILITLGMLGGSLETNALISLASHLPSNVIFFLYLFGFLAVFTSFLSIGFEFKNLLVDDYKFNPNVAWLTACCAPLLLYFSGISNFVKVIGFVGAIALGLMGILVFMMYLKLKEQGKEMFFKLHLPKVVVYILMAVFALGVCAEVFYLLR